MLYVVGQCVAHDLDRSASVSSGALQVVVVSSSSREQRETDRQRREKLFACFLAETRRGESKKFEVRVRKVGEGQDPEEP